MFAYMTNGISPRNCTCGHHCHDDRLVYDVTDVQRILGLKSRRSVEKLIKSGRLRSYMVLSLRKIDRSAVEEYLASAIAPEYTANEAR